MPRGSIVPDVGSDAKRVASIVPDVGSDAKRVASIVPDVGSDAKRVASIVPDVGSDAKRVAWLDRRIMWVLPFVVAMIAIALPHTGTRPETIDRIEDAKGRRFGLTTVERKALFKDIAANDARWRQIAERNYPGDVWAQADHWTDHMSAHVRWMTEEYGASVTQILLSYDEGLHKGWRGPGNRLMRTSWPPLTKHRR